ncbi:velvet factor-domain-containing protein [Cubamyces menziesii]|nr:velvet factor-domain-containing protein [Cubamyces menziesii]
MHPSSLAPTTSDPGPGTGAYLTLFLAGNLDTFSVSEQLPPLYTALQSGYPSSQPFIPSSRRPGWGSGFDTQDQNAADGVVAWFGSYPIQESSNCTQALAGATFTTAVVIDHDSKPTAMFVFSDLAVQIEGTFVLRYRIFNIFSDCAIPPHKPVLAACYGGPFRVYSTKTFPGLLASTPLTKVPYYISPSSHLLSMDLNHSSLILA